MTSPLPPGATIGILGGGPVGRGIALAARMLGYRVRALDADPAALVGPLAERSVRVPLTDAAAAVEALEGCDVLTPSVEHVPPRTLAALEHAGMPIRPGVALLNVAQDRVLERGWLSARGIPLAPWSAASTLQEALAAVDALGGRCVLKPALRQGAAPDVRRAGTRTEVEAAWREFGGGRCAVEPVLAIDTELTVVVARTAAGAAAAYPPARSERLECRGAPRLLWSVLPDGGPSPHAEKARRLAMFVAERLGVEGLLAVEMFLLADGRLVVNELVPCPHPTYLAADDACGTGQYEQLVRAVCGLPLGATDLVQPVAVAPVYGDTWLAGAATRAHVALRVPGVALRLEDIAVPGPDQRLGYVAARGATPAEAVQRAMWAHAQLAGDPEERSEGDPAAGGRVRATRTASGTPEPRHLRDLVAGLA